MAKMIMTIRLRSYCQQFIQWMSSKMDYLSTSCQRSHGRRPPTSLDSAYCNVLWGVYTVQQTSSKLPANVMLDVCWTFAGSCKHPITDCPLVISSKT